MKRLYALATIACFLPGCSSPEPTADRLAPSFPLPTENWLEEDAEAKQKERRKAWFRELHQAPPGVDWKAVERVNGRRQIDKRNALALSASASPTRWVERGSDNQAGRMHVAVLSSDGQTLYAGSSKGGVWIGALDGSSWTPIGDNLYGGAHWMATVPGAGAGAPDAILAATDGGLIHVTTDLGASWFVPTGFVQTPQEVRRVATLSDGSNIVLVLTREGNRRRLYRSTDALQSFEEIYDLGTYSGDVWAPRDGGGDIYLLSRNNLLKSVDHGQTWATVAPTPATSTRGELCGSEAGAPRLWTVLSVGGQYELHRSDDAGATWTYLTTISDYWGSLNASIQDVDLFAYGGVELFRTFDGGGTFTKANNWYDYYNDPENSLHADIPGIDVCPTGPQGETWYVSTDGGLFRSEDKLVGVENLANDGLRVSQYYSTLTSAVDPDHVAAGAQDQGYQWADSAPSVGTVLSFDQLISGDYGHLTSGDGSHAWVISTYPGFILVQKGETGPELFSADFPDGETNAWMPPVVADTQDRRDFFFCATRIYHYDKNLGSNSWTASLWSTFDFAATGGEYVSALEFSPLDPQRAYAVTNRGRLFHSEDRALTWTASTTTGPTGQYFYGTALAASAGDVDTVYVGGSGYGGPAIYRSVDGGVSFQVFDQGLPDTLVYCLEEAPDGSGDLFCGTETAAYRRDAGAAEWVDVTSNEAPVTIYWSVEAHPAENSMRFATYGRGVWDYEVDPASMAVVRNGSDTNRVCFANQTGPTLGGDWTVEVDAAGHPGATLSGFLMHGAPTSGVFVQGFELLVDLAAPRYFATIQVSTGGTDVYTYGIPPDPSLSGLEAFSQAFLLGSGLELCNALDVVVGR